MELIKNEKALEIYTDGAARGNPGPAAISYIIINEKQIIKKGSEYIGTATNNTAEYRAIIAGITAAKNITNNEIKVYSDSNLAIQQINGNWKINYPHLLKLYKEINLLKQSFKKVEFFHKKRENKFIILCDQSCNDILDKRNPSK